MGTGPVHILGLPLPSPTPNTNVPPQVLGERDYFGSNGITGVAVEFPACMPRMHAPLWNVEIPLEFKVAGLGRSR